MGCVSVRRTACAGGSPASGATGPADVGSVPGRLQAVGERVVVPAVPEFGGNAAETVLTATDADREVRGALTLATSDSLLAAARQRGIDPIAFDADYEDRQQRLASAFGERGSVPRVVYHEGAFGIEPGSSVFGESAVAAVDLALELVADAGQ